MSLALGVLIIFIICIPGIVIRLTYLSSPYSKRNINTTTIEEVFHSLVPAFVFHFVFIEVIRLLGYSIDFQFLYNLIGGSTSAQHVNLVNTYLPGFFIYMLLNTAVNFVAAYYSRKIVLQYRLSERWAFLEIYNRWYYILMPVPDNDKVISVWLDLLVECNEGSMIYRGFLTDFWLDQDGGIKELHMEDVRRRLLSTDLKPFTSNATPDNEKDALIQVEERYYYIPGELFVINYSDVKNMNITYFEES